MAGIDYTTAVMKDRKRIRNYIWNEDEPDLDKHIFIEAALWVEGIKITGYKYGIYFNDKSIYEWIRSNRGKIRGFVRQPLKVYMPEEHGDPEQFEIWKQKYAYAFRLNRHLVAFFPESDTFGGASYLYILGEEPGDIQMIATGYGHYNNPYLHMLDRGLGKDAEAKMIKQLWDAMAEDAIDMYELFGDMEFDRDGVKDDWLITAPTLVAFRNRMDKEKKLVRERSRREYEEKLKQREAKMQDNPETDA